MKNKKLESISREIEYYFQFLLDRGYKVYDIKELPMGNWQVIFALNDCAIVIYSDRDDVDILFSPIDSNFDYRVGLSTMIYFLTNGQVFVGRSKKSFFNTRKKSFEKLSNLLKEYIDRIIPYFGRDYEKYKHELMLTQQKHLDIYLDTYIPKRKQRNWE